MTPKELEDRVLAIWASTGWRDRASGAWILGDAAWDAYLAAATDYPGFAMLPQGNRPPTICGQPVDIAVGSNDPDAIEYTSKYTLA